MELAFHEETPRRVEIETAPSGTTAFNPQTRNAAEER